MEPQTPEQHEKDYLCYVRRGRTTLPLAEFVALREQNWQRIQEHFRSLMQALPPPQPQE